MVEKYKGIMPPNSIWYRLTRNESIVLMKHQGKFDKLSTEKKATLASMDVQGIPGEISELEELFISAGLTITPLHD